MNSICFTPGSSVLICLNRMELEEAFKVQWEQLPQRQLWLDAKPETPAKSSRLARNKDVKISIRSATAPATTQAGSWEYLDHTADVQVHSHGRDLGEAFAAAVVGMYGYMVELVQIPSDLEIVVQSQGHDKESLLFNFMDECLYVFHTENFVMKQVIVEELNQQSWQLRAVARGGLFDVSKHSQGTEVKAITYSNMQILEKDDGVDVYVIVDI